MKKCLTIIAAMWLLCSPVLGQSYDLLTRANSGDSFAQLILGDMFVAGEGVAQDYAEAFFWYRKAAQGGVAKAQLALGLMYSQGQGVQQDLETAYLWIFIAAMQGAQDAIASRDEIGAQLDAAAREQTQQLATRCIESRFTQCE